MCNVQCAKHCSGPVSQIREVDWNKHSHKRVNNGSL
jgi:hypothetical protein